MALQGLKKPPTTLQQNSARRAVCMAGKGKLPAAFEDIGSPLLRAPKLILSDAERQRLDESPDGQFYNTPRMMQHADDSFLQALTGIYALILPPGAAVLELCASAHSHLPDTLQPPRLMVGQGMNSNEMAANPSLHQHFLQDLNLQPLLLEQLDASYDVVLCVNGIQYLTQVETVIGEASRVLHPGGMLVVAFGPDCFREKALAGWLSRSMQERTQLLQAIIAANGFGTPAVLDSPAAADHMIRSMQHTTSSSPAPQATARVSPASAAAAQRLAQQRPHKQATPPSVAGGAHNVQHRDAQGPKGSNSSSNGADKAYPTQHQQAVQQPHSSSSANGSAGTGAAQEEPAGVTVPKNGNQNSDSNGSVASVDRGQQEVDPGLQLQVLVAWKAVDWTAGAAEADTAAVDMRPENVQAWFTKPGLAGLAEAAANSNAAGAAAGESNGATPTPAFTSTPHAQNSSNSAPQPAANSAASLTGGSASQKLLEQWHAAYNSLVTDAVDLGIPRSVIPTVKPDASPAELQAAVQHLQDMMASFLSSGL